MLHIFKGSGKLIMTEEGGMYTPYPLSHLVFAVSTEIISSYPHGDNLPVFINVDALCIVCIGNEPACYQVRTLMVWGSRKMA